MLTKSVEQSYTKVPNQIRSCVQGSRHNTDRSNFTDDKFFLLEISSAEGATIQHRFDKDVVNPVGYAVIVEALYGEMDWLVLRAGAANDKIRCLTYEFSNCMTVSAVPVLAFGSPTIMSMELKWTAARCFGDHHRRRLLQYHMHAR